jgi:hypothetical protein
MKPRNFRIAWSVGWGVVAMLLVVLWVRSYWRSDYLILGRALDETEFVSAVGRLLYVRADGDFDMRGFKWGTNEVTNLEIERE